MMLKYLVFALSIVLAAGCSLNPNTGQGSKSEDGGRVIHNKETSSEFASNSEEAMSRAGLPIPKSATSIGMEILEIPGRREAYVVSFRTSHDDAVTLGNLVGGGNLGIGYLHGSDREGLPSSVSGDEWSLYNSSWAPKQPNWSRTVIFNTANPAQVYVKIEYIY